MGCVEFMEFMEFLVTISVPLKYFSSFRRSLQMPLINCKVELSLRWIQNCLLTTAAIGASANATGVDSATFKISDAKLYVAALENRKQCKISKTIRL